MTYEGSGVDYSALDGFKRACQKYAATTSSLLQLHGAAEADKTRGESAYLIETPTGYLAHVEEGLGTKNLVADAMQALTGQSFYYNVGIDTVATIVNDLITTGALPLSVAMHAGVGDSAWFSDQVRAEELAKGFAQGCKLSNAAWGGGETPALKGIIDPRTIVLAGSAIGQIQNKAHRIKGNVRDGDVIIMLASSGVQTNGLTLCRALADRLSKGYLEPLSNGRTYGEALLDASVIYVPFIAACQKAGVDLHYAVHMTGHGWRKLMRLEEPFVYTIANPGQPQPIFDFLRKNGPITLQEAYATFNMGAGFAVYVSPKDAGACVRLADEAQLTAWIAGTVQKQGSRKAVEIPPLNLSFDGDSLQLR